MNRNETWSDLTLDERGIHSWLDNKNRELANENIKNFKYIIKIFLMKGHKFESN